MGGVRKGKWGREVQRRTERRKKKKKKKKKPDFKEI